MHYVRDEIECRIAIGKLLFRGGMRKAERLYLLSNTAKLIVAAVICQTFFIRRPFRNRYRCSLYAEHFRLYLISKSVIADMDPLFVAVVKIRIYVQKQFAGCLLMSDFTGYIQRKRC